MARTTTDTPSGDIVRTMLVCGTVLLHSGGLAGWGLIIPAVGLAVHCVVK
mgnify:CR=1 FL=1